MGSENAVKQGKQNIWYKLDQKRKKWFFLILQLYSKKSLEDFIEKLLELIRQFIKGNWT